MDISRICLSGASLLFALSTVFPSFLRADTQLIYQTGVSVLPGSDTAFTQLNGASLFGATPFIYGLTRVDNVTHHNAILYKDGALATLINGQTGFLDGSALLNLNPSIGDAAAPYFSLVSLNNPRDGALVRYQNGQLVTVIQSARQLMDAGNGARHFGRASVSAAGPLAMTGFDAGFPHFMLRYANGQLQILAEESVTVIPGSDVKFAKFSLLPEITPDGKRVYFYGASAGNSSSGSYRDGLYYWENGTVHKVVDTKDTFPGTSSNYNSLIDAGYRVIIAPDGTLYFLAGSERNEQYGILSFSPNGITQIVEKATVIDGTTVGYISNMDITADGTLVFTSGQNYFTYKNGETKALIRSTNTSYPSNRFWVFGNDIYVTMTSYSGDPIVTDRFFSRINVATGEQEPLYPLINSLLHEGVYLPEVYYFDINDGKFLMGTLTSVIYGDLADLGAASAPNPIEDFFYVFMDAGNEIYYAHAYEWLYAPSGYWPIVYSFTANKWLYLAHDWGYPLVAYAFDIGWIYSEPEIWPQYYLFETQTWTTF